jgi:hypothetical protein
MNGDILRRFGWSKVFAAVRCNADTESSAGADVNDHRHGRVMSKFSAAASSCLTIAMEGGFTQR